MTVFWYFNSVYGITTRTITIRISPLPRSICRCPCPSSCSSSSNRWHHPLYSNNPYSPIGTQSNTIMKNTSFPPRWKYLSRNRESSSKSLEDCVHSLMMFWMNGMVFSLAGFRGVWQVLEGQSSGSSVVRNSEYSIHPLHQLISWPGMFNSGMTRIPNEKAYFTMSWISFY